tara:strand:- start:250 stop:1437 length:1188 start_codon:yes stop_codon:yes gene_type:complete
MKKNPTNPSPTLSSLKEPQARPSHPYFSSGPCAKFPGWSLDLLKDAAIGRSHRSAYGLDKLCEAVNLTREILDIPRDYKVALLPGSATGAIESALWNLLGPMPVTVFSHDVFSLRWEKDLTRHLKLRNIDIRQASHGDLPETKGIPSHNDILLNWNGSTSGVRFPTGDFLEKNRAGLVIADITSAAFTTSIPWEKFDATAFAWQKGLGSESAHGMLVLSPKAIERLNTYQPPWPLPYLFNLRIKNQFYAPLFEEKTLNTPSFLCIEDYLQALKWAQKEGGLSALIRRSQDNFQVIAQWVDHTPWIEFMATAPDTRSTSTVSLKLTDPKILTLSEAGHREFLAKLTGLLAERHVAYDINNHGGAPPSLRLWGGPTLDSEDMAKVLPWVEWAYEASL